MAGSGLPSTAIGLPIPRITSWDSSIKLKRPHRTALIVHVGPPPGLELEATVRYDVPGNLDGDGQSDLADTSFLAGCMDGPGLSVAPECGPADMAGDSDVDLADLALFEADIGCPYPQTAHTAL